jgi:hypothetical protein
MARVIARNDCQIGGLHAANSRNERELTEHCDNCTYTGLRAVSSKSAISHLELDEIKMALQQGCCWPTEERLAHPHAATSR